MPLLKRARIEVYLPRSNDAAYSRIRAAFEKEFASTFGGYTLITDLKGSYLNESGGIDVDVIDLLYVDAPFDIGDYGSEIADYAVALQEIILKATPEEAVLVVVHEAQHVVRGNKQ